MITSFVPSDTLIRLLYAGVPATHSIKQMMAFTKQQLGLVFPTTLRSIRDKKLFWSRVECDFLVVDEKYRVNINLISEVRSRIDLPKNAKIIVPNLALRFGEEICSWLVRNPEDGKSQGLKWDRRTIMLERKEQFPGIDKLSLENVNVFMRDPC